MPGDFATIEADGSVTLLGRGSICINSGGEKIFPEEVEAVVRNHPDVMDAIVVGAPDERFGQRVAAIVEPRPGHTGPVARGRPGALPGPRGRLQGPPPAPRGRQDRALPQREARLPLGQRHRHHGARRHLIGAPTGPLDPCPSALRPGRRRTGRRPHHGAPTRRGRRPLELPGPGRRGRARRPHRPHGPPPGRRPRRRGPRRPLHGRLPGRPARARRPTPPSSPPCSADPSISSRAPPPSSSSPPSGPSPSDLVSHRRHGVSPFIGTDLDPTLRALGVSTVVATGVSLNLGIIGLAVEAVNLGYRVVLATDAVAGVPADFAADVLRHTLALVATLATVDEIIAAFAVRARPDPEREPPPAAPTPGGPRVAQGRRPDRAPALARTRRWQRRRSPPLAKSRVWLPERVRAPERQMPGSTGAGPTGRRPARPARAGGTALLTALPFACSGSAVHRCAGDSRYVQPDLGFSLPGGAVHGVLVELRAGRACRRWPPPLRTSRWAWPTTASRSSAGRPPSPRSA